MAREGDTYELAADTSGQQEREKSSAADQSCRVWGRRWEQNCQGAGCQRLRLPVPHTREAAPVAAPRPVPQKPEWWAVTRVRHKGALMAPTPSATAQPGSDPDSNGHKNSKQWRTEPAGALLPLPILEETEGFMGPNPDEAFHRQRLQGPQCFKDTSDPPGHFPG